MRDDDRYLFLEAILSARDALYLSWLYRNPSDNAAREPFAPSLFSCRTGLAILCE